MRPDKPLEENEALRLRMWSVFRPGIRDHVVPMTSLGRVWQRFQVREAWGVPSAEQAIAAAVVAGAASSGARAAAVGAPVGEAAVGAAAPAVARAGVAAAVAARSPEERARAREERERALRPRVAEEGPVLRQTQYLYFELNSDPVTVANVEDQVHEIGVAPYDGFLTEVVIEEFGSSGERLVALRTESGQSFATATSNIAYGNPWLDPRPDFFDAERLAQTFVVGGRSVLRSNVPVRAGERIYLVMRLAGLPLGGTMTVTGMVGVEAARAVGVGAAAVRQTVREQQVEVERIVRRVVQRVPVVEEVPVAVPVERGGRVVPPRPALRLGPPAPPAGGEGLTFVEAWMPQAGAIGYLVPTPPPGARVNVFGDRFTIWDGSGRKVSEGTVQVVRSEQDIPEGARRSRSLGVVPSPGLPISVPVGGQLVPAQAVVTPSGRPAIVTRTPTGAGGLVVGAAPAASEIRFG